MGVEDHEMREGEVPKRFCTSCGASLAPGQRFCTNCGAPVPEAAPAEPAEADEPSAQPEQPEPKEATEQEGPVEPEEVVEEEPAEPTEPEDGEEPADAEVTEVLPADGDPGGPEPEGEGAAPDATDVLPEPAAAPETAPAPVPEGAGPKRGIPKRAIIIAAAAVAAVVIAVAGWYLLYHDWERATCTESRTCTRCGETDGEPLGHDVGEWEVVTEATCTQQGERRGTCTRCGEELSETIDKVDHTPGDWQVTTDVTVTSSGDVIDGEESRVCTACGAVVETRPYTMELTVSQANALRSAASYLDFTHFSHSGLVDQLEFEGYSTEDATFAADHCGADWNEQAAGKAQDYLDFMGFSRQGLIDQLMFEGFTYEQAVYGVDAVGL